MPEKRHGWAGKLQRTRSWTAQRSLSWRCLRAAMATGRRRKSQATAGTSSQASAVEQLPIKLWGSVRAVHGTCTVVAALYTLACHTYCCVFHTRHQVVCAVRKFSFRSLHAAVAAARDGDQILLKRGIHNGLGCGSAACTSVPMTLTHATLAALLSSGRFCRSKPPVPLSVERRETVHVSKRVLIRGEGTLGETRIDQRANCPALRIGRTCLVQEIFGLILN